MGISEFFFGSDPKMKKMNNFTQEQQRGHQDYWNNPIQNSPLYGAGQDWIQRILSNDPEAYADFEKPIMNQFEQQIVPAIAERFGGIAGNKGNSGLNNSLAQAGKDLSTNIGGIRAGLQQNAVNQGLAYAQQPYSNAQAGFGVREFENVQQPGTEGLISPLLKKGLGAAASSFGAPMGQAASKYFLG
jgi:hypothetical protein